MIAAHSLFVVSICNAFPPTDDNMLQSYQKINASTPRFIEKLIKYLGW